MQAFHVGDANMLVSEKPRGPNAYPHGPNAKPNMSRWNIAHVRCPRIGPRVGHVDFMLLVSISSASRRQRKPCFQWCMDLNTCIWKYKLADNKII